MTKNYKGFDVFVMVMGALAILALVVILFNWPIMILFGVVHTFWPAVPALGFWQTLVVSILVKMLTASSSYNSRS